jgi:hypothetical protein
MPDVYQQAASLLPDYLIASGDHPGKARIRYASVQE